LNQPAPTGTQEFPAISATISAMFELRPATADDLPAVAAIYADAVAHSHATFDTSPPADEVWQARLASTEPGDAFLVAVADTTVLGFAYSSAHRPRPAYHRSRETTIYLAEAARGQGVGGSLYGALLDLLRADGVRTALGVVALPNEASEALHRAVGFTKVGHLAEVGHKFGRWVDVAMYQVMLSRD